MGEAQAARLPLQMEGRPLCRPPEDVRAHTSFHKKIASWKLVSGRRQAGMPALQKGSQAGSRRMTEKIMRLFEKLAMRASADQD
jgi:hypothetical protein